MKSNSYLARKVHKATARMTHEQTSPVREAKLGQSLAGLVADWGAEQRAIYRDTEAMRAHGRALLKSKAASERLIGRLLIREAGK